MPVIIPERDYDRWLRSEPDRPPIDLLRPFDADKMSLEGGQSCGQREE
jgi:putative SOS response-associated peptidase YedK